MRFFTSNPVVESMLLVGVLCLPTTVTAQGVAEPPWEGQYKITPGQIDRLTPADVVGPDGIVYPNWTRTGVEGGIPDIATAVTIEQFGGRANDDRDDSAALEQACAAVGKNGGGAVLLGEGTYDLDWPVTIRDNGVVIRGSGREKTRLRFRYAIGASGVRFYGLTAGSRVGRGSSIILHCEPTGLMKMKILLDDQEIHQWERSTHSGNTFACEASWSKIAGKFPDGDHVLRGVAEYKDGTLRDDRIRVVLDSSYQDTKPAAGWQAALLFAGHGRVGDPIRLSRDGRRGDLELELENVKGLSAGDCLYLEAPATERWKKLTKNACLWGRYRAYQVRIQKIDGRRVILDQPLRIEFPVIDGAFACRVEPIQRCGVEDLTLEQTENLWITSVLFRDAWNCWARGVTIRKCGRFPVYGSYAKWCEIRDCVFDDAWFKGGGGTAYGGWDGCCDCLMDGCETFKLRHAPLFQWAASGNVIRNSTFHDSDGQWHAGWTNENLIEGCTIDSAYGNGGYGYGMWASPPEDSAHGPNGPRNVVYNCHVRSPKTGLWMGGMNENWLILHNRFEVGSGAGVLAKTASFDHILRGNVFVLNDQKSPMVQLATSDCIGVEILDNRLAGGSGQFVSGPAQPLRLEGNQVVDDASDAPLRPAVPSIYQWQQDHLQGR